MGINFDGVNPEVKAKLEGIVSDDKVTAEEVKGLSEAEQAALSKALGGIDLPKTGEIKLVSEPNMPKEEPGLFEKAWDWVKENPRKAVGCAVIIAACVITAGAFGAFGATTAATIKGVGTWIAANRATVGLGCIAGCAVLTSCNKEDFEEPTETLPGNVTNFYNNLTITVNNESSDEEILEEIRKLREEQKQANAAILQALLENGISLNRIVDLLSKMGMEINDIYGALETIAGSNEEIKIVLKEILTEVQNGNKLTVEGNELLNKIIEKLGSAESNQADVQEILKQMLQELRTIVEKGENYNEAEKARDEKVQVLLQTILENMQAFNSDFKGGVDAILKQLENMSDTQLEMLNAVYNIYDKLGVEADNIIKAIMNGQTLTQEQLNKIIENQNLQNDELASIRELIVQNNEIAQGTQDAVKDMSANMTNEHNAILNAIKNVQAGGGDYSDLKAILEEIRDNTSVLPDVQQQLCLVGTAIEKILEEVKGIRVETQKGLLAILAKIPNGCTCETVDLSGILEKLDELLAELKKDPADNTDEPDNDKDDHEGILKNLEDYFG